MCADYTAIKIICSWSKSLSVTYVTFADTRVSDIPSVSKHKVLSTLIAKIEENCAIDDSNFLFKKE